MDEGTTEKQRFYIHIHLTARASEKSFLIPQTAELSERLFRSKIATMDKSNIEAQIMQTVPVVSPEILRPVADMFLDEITV